MSQAGRGGSRMTRHFEPSQQPGMTPGDLSRSINRGATGLLGESLGGVALAGKLGS